MITELFDPRATVAGSGPAFRVAAGVDMGNGTYALLTIAATRNATTPALSATSVSLLAANADGRRYGLKITNNDGASTAYLGFGVAAVVGTGVAIPPGASWSWLGAGAMESGQGAIITNALFQGAINQIGSGTPTGNLKVEEVVTA